MAAKKDTPAGYDRWDTFTGTIKATGTLTPTQKKAIEKAKLEQKQAKQKSKK